MVSSMFRLEEVKEETDEIKLVLQAAGNHDTYDLSRYLTPP